MFEMDYGTVARRVGAVPVVWMGGNKVSKGQVMAFA